MQTRDHRTYADWDEPPKESRFNSGLVLRTLVGLVIVAGVGYGLRQYFMGQNCVVLEQRAKKAIAAGEVKNGLQLYRQYLNLGRISKILTPEEQADVLEQIADLEEQSATDSRQVRSLVAAEEELLRLSPERRAIRYRLIERLRLTGRYSDAVAHLETLKQKASPDEVAKLDDLLAECEFRLRNFAEAQSGWGRSLEAQPAQIEAYIGLARLWTQTDLADLPAGLAKRSKRWDDLHKRLSDSDGQPRLGQTHAAVAILNLMRTEAVAPDAQLAMVRLILELPPARQVLSRNERGAEEESGRIIREADSNKNGRLDDAELLSHQLQQVEFADLDMDGVILREELKARLLLSEQEARLTCASAVLSSLPPDPDHREQLLPVKLDLLHARSQAVQGLDPTKSAALREETRNVAEQGLEFPDLRARCEVVLAQLDLETAVGARAEERVAALERSHDHARKGLAALPAAKPLLRYSASADELYTLRQQARLTLADVLLQQAESRPADQRADLLKEAMELTAELERSGVIPLLTDGLRLHEAILSGRQRDIVGLASRIRDAGFAQASWRNRTASLLVRAYRQLGHKEQAVDVLSDLAKADPTSALAQFGLAESLIADGRAPEAMIHLEAAIRAPGAAVRLCHLLLRKEAAVVPVERNWEQLDRAEQVAAEVSGETPEYAAMFLDSLRLRLWTAAALRSTETAPAQLTPAERQDLDDRYSQALEKFPQSTELWQGWIQTTAERTDLPVDRHKDLIRERLAAAREAVGNTPALLIAEAGAMLPRDEDQQLAFLKQIEERAAAMPASDQRLVLESLATWCSRNRKHADALRIWQQICSLTPQDAAAWQQLAEALLALKWEDPQYEVPAGPWDSALAAITTVEGTPDSTAAYLRGWRLLLEARSNKDPASSRQQQVQAQTEMVKVQKSRPTWAAVYRLTGLVYSLRGEADKAHAEWQRAYDLGDRSPGVVMELFAYLRANSKKTETAQLLQKLEAEDRSQLSGALGRSLISWAATNQSSEEALKIARRVANRSGDASDRLEVLRLAFRTGEYDPAEILAFAEGEGSSLPGVWELLLQTRLQNKDNSNGIDEVVTLAEKLLPQTPADLKPRTLARLHELIGIAMPDRRAAAWTAAAEYFRQTLAVTPDDSAVRLAAVRLAIATRNQQEATALFEPLQSNLASLTVPVQREVHLLAARMALLGAVPGGTRLARDSLVAAIELGEDSAATLEVLAACIDKAATPTDLAAVAKAVLAMKGTATEEAQRGPLIARLLALAGLWKEAEERFQSLVDRYPSSAPVLRAYLEQMTKQLSKDPKLQPKTQDLLERLSGLAPTEWETARCRAQFYEATGQPTRATDVLENAARMRLQRSTDDVAKEWLSRPDWQSTADRLFDLQMAAPALRPAWDEVVALMLKRDPQGATERLSKADLAALVVEWNLMFVAEATTLLERMKAFSTAELLHREMVKQSSNQNRTLELSAYLTRQKNPGASLDLLESNWDQLDPLAAATSALAVTESGPVSTEALKRLLDRVTTAAERESNPLRQARLYLILGNLIQSLQDWDGALAAYSRVIELDPEHAVGQNNTAYMLAKLGRDLPKARAAITEALRLDALRTPGTESDVKSNTDMIDTQAAVSLEEGNPRQAIEELKRAKNLSNNEKLQVRLAEALWQSGEKTKAMEALNRAIQLGWTPQHSHPLDRPRHAVIAKAAAERSPQPAPKP